ncbi:hypothetical protein LDENG_00066490, partial [Lucifuga dentata]
MVLAIVFVSLLLDSMLLSVVVPILPSYLYKIDHEATITSGNSTNSTVSPSAIQPLSSVAHNLSDSNCSEAYDQLDKENVKLGLLLASKSTVQIITNIFTGPLIDRTGYHVPMCAGFCIVFLATMMFAFSSSYILLLLARSVQGVGGSCLTIAGMGMVADVFTADEERGKAMGISFTGLALGLIVGIPFGSVMYEFVGKSAPFVVLAVIAALGGGT